MTKTLTALFVAALAAVLFPPAATAVDCPPDPPYTTPGEFVEYAAEQDMALLIARAGQRTEPTDDSADVGVEFDVLVRFGDAPPLDTVVANHHQMTPPPHDPGTLVLSFVEEVDGRWDFGGGFLCGSFVLDEADVDPLAERGREVMGVTVVDTTQGEDSSGSMGTLPIIAGLGVALVAAVAALVLRAKGRSTTP